MSGRPCCESCGGPLPRPRQDLSERDARILDKLKAPRATFESVAADLGLTKGQVAGVAFWDRRP